MNVLVCGARGFIGAALCARLAAAGHIVKRGVRTVADDNDLCIDFSRDVSADDWIPKLRGIDAVINAVGILVERSNQSFEDIHRRAPIALFSACAIAGVQRVIQVSALGAERGDTHYFSSKLAADTFLMAQPLDWQIVRPALVYGCNGASAKYFRSLSSLPVIPVPAQGRQMVQPVHIDDLTQVVLTLLDPATPARQCINVVGSRQLEYREMLQVYRRSMEFPPVRFQPVDATH